jgi:hypothetical protein
VAPGGHADLALVEERTEGADRHGLFEVDVVHDDQGGVAAEFEVHALEVLSAERTHHPASDGRAGEGDDVHERVDDQRLTHISATGQHAEDARGQTRLFEDASEHHAAAHRGPRVRLQDDRVAQRQRRGHRADGKD